MRENIVKAPRGRIYDVNGNILADNKTGYKIIHKFTPTISLNERNILEQLNLGFNANYIKLSDKKRSKIDELFFDIKYISRISNSDFDEILDIFYHTPASGVDKEIVVVEDIDELVALKEVENLPNRRIDIVEYAKRKYPNKHLASNAIGYVKLIDEKEYKELKEKGYRIDDLIGKKGIEKHYDSIMKGQNGSEFVEVNARGSVINKIEENEPVSGQNIYMSIDLRLQEIMTKAYEGQSGAFAAIDVKTGKIITFVSTPEIDLNVLSSKINQKQWNKLLNSSKTPLVNKMIAGLYPPGSTFKVVSAASILESNISPYDTTYSTGSYTIGGVTFRDSKLSGYGTTNLYKAIGSSVNTYFYEMIQKVGKDKMIETAFDFGYGQKIGIDIPGELSGLVPTPEWKKQRFKSKQSQVWLPGDLINLSIGQGYLLATPLQVLMTYQAIANDGVMVKPTLVDKFVDSNGNVVHNNAQILKTLNVSEENISHIKKGLRKAVSDDGGTAKILRFPYVNVSAKTGTAQNSKKENHAWIAGYFPSENPEIAFVALVENAGYGAVAAGPKARTFIENYYKKGEIDEK